MCLMGSGRHRIELSRLGIGFQLAIPQFRVKLRKPLPEGRRLLRRQVLHLALQIVDLAHQKSPDATHNYTAGGTVFFADARPTAPDRYT